MEERGMHRMEMLAPAGNREALERACAAGADAVYLGFSAFSARAGAGNFDREALEAALHFAHLHHMHVHVAVNTLVKDTEIAEVMEVLSLLNSLRVDAVLVQDLGILYLARKCFPSLPLHASTQMAIHNESGVAFCQAQGIRRVVLARECSLEEIRRCTAFGKDPDHPVEIEVFCHGAQCVSVSGECLFSSCIGGRSGNRGRCAQPCRLMYTYQGVQGAWLSPRDVCMRGNLDALQAAGVDSLKIEGRLKRPEYVATVTESYSRGIRQARDGEDSRPDAGEMEDLRQIFQRGGFMDGYAMGAEDAAVIDSEHVSHRGVSIGRVTEVTRDGRFAGVLLTRDLADTDQLAFSHTRDGEMIYSGLSVRAGETARIRLRPGMSVRPGCEVRRLTSAAQLQAAERLPIPAIPVSAFLTALPGEPLTLRVSDGESEAVCTGDRVEAAQKRALSAEEAERAIGKTGDTPFVLTAFSSKTEGAFVPASALNALRREALLSLEEKRTAAFARGAGESFPPDACVLPEGTEPSLLMFADPEQLQELPGDMRPVWMPEDYREDALEKGLSDLPRGVWLHLPMVCEESTLQELHAFVSRHTDKLGGVVLGSVGQLGLAWPLPYGTGSGVPVLNRRAAQFLFAQGCAFVTASPECSKTELESLTEACGRILVPAFGRTQLMLLHHCPARTLLGLSSGHRDCRMCDTGDRHALKDTFLEDRFGEKLPLVRVRLPEGCLVRLLSSRPVNLVRKARELAGEPPLSIELGPHDRYPACLEEQATTGHWGRGVE